jgi:hypothetical protein
VTRDDGHPAAACIAIGSRGVRFALAPPAARDDRGVGGFGAGPGGDRLTGDAAPALHQAADEAGADGVFVKDEFLEKLLTRLARVAESRQPS